MAWVEGSVVATAGQALDRRLDELAATVCAADPRTRKQRRADALGALAAGIERLVCGCGSAQCAVSEPERSSNIVIHVIAERASVEGAGTAPGVLAGSEWLVPAELVAELAKSARLVPVIRPARLPNRDTPHRRNWLTLCAVATSLAGLPGVTARPPTATSTTRCPTRLAASRTPRT